MNYIKRKRAPFLPSFIFGQIHIVRIPPNFQSGRAVKHFQTTVYLGTENFPKLLGELVLKKLFFILRSTNNVLNKQSVQPTSLSKPLLGL